MVVQLADLLRRLLNAGERDFSRLSDELHFVRLYLELQQRRFADRLSVELPNPAELPAVWVPSLILQPLVENAVVHGMAGHQGAVKVEVTATVDSDTLTVRVRNTMASDRSTSGNGIGLKNVRERIAVQYEGRASLQTSSTGTEWLSELSIPAIAESPSMTRDPTTAPGYRPAKLVRI
jgi:LytS/YehU family sensor histidine kinase